MQVVMKIMKLKRLISFILACCVIIPLNKTSVIAAELNVSAPSAIVIEASTGQIIYEKNADEKRSPASITKIMTLLLTFEALEKGKIKLSDEAMTSAHAKSMGGSQVFLEEGEVQDVETLIKCVAVASGNDAAVTLAEFLAGSEEEFVYQMNQKAQALGMTDTHFTDCCGLTDSDEHYTTAADVTKMSRELIMKYPEIFDYTKIWMEDITHSTNRGTETFTLSSTNKLLKSYEWTTGLKTGSTSKAKFCVSATAHKNDMDLIAVVMGAENGKSRFQDAITLLNYGYSVSHLYEDTHKKKLTPILIQGAVEETLPITYKETFRYLDVTGADLNNVEKIVSLPETVTAPIQKGDVIGEVIYKLNDAQIGSVQIVSAETMEKASYKDFIKKTLQYFLLGA